MKATYLYFDSHADAIATLGPDEWPDQYLVIENCQTGDVVIRPLSPLAKLNLTKLVKRWITQTFGGELVLDGKIERVGGQYYAHIKTDGRPLDSIVVWAAGGFYLKANE